VLLSYQNNVLRCCSKSVLPLKKERAAVLLLNIILA